MIFILDFDVIKNVLIISIAAGIITTGLMQKIKSFASQSYHIPIYSFFISMLIGTLFALTFSDVSLIYALWTGLFAFIGADALYQAFEDKIFTPFSDMKPVIIIDRNEKDGNS